MIYGLRLTHLIDLGRQVRPAECEYTLDAGEIEENLKPATATLKWNMDRDLRDHWKKRSHLRKNHIKFDGRV
jgi:hypothetical protein